MTNPYRDIFAAPGAAAFSAAGFLARVPMAMVGIGIVTMFSQLRGDYGLGGALAAVFALSNAVITPMVSRAVDRYGQRRVLPLASGTSAAATAAMLLCVRLGAPAWTFFVCAVPAGVMPTIGAMVRARWTELYRGSPKLRTAFAFESVVDELCFVVGPVLSVGLCVAVFPEAGPLLGAVLLVAGTLALAALRGTEPPVRLIPAGSGGSVIRNPVVWVLVVVMASMGTIFGVIDVVAVAFTAQRHVPGAATIVLALFAVGSGLSGLVFGTLRLRAPLPRQLLVVTAAVSILLWPMLAAGAVPTLAVAYLVAGMTVAPTMIVATAYVEQIVPAAELTEGITWIVTGIGVGVAVGSALAGRAIDRAGTDAGIAVALVAGLVACIGAAGVHLHESRVT